MVSATDVPAPAFHGVKRQDDVQMVAVGTRVYAIGGEDGDGRVLASVECYDPYRNTWQIVRFERDHASCPTNNVLYGKGIDPRKWLTI
jgi:hypothetical protein